MVAIIGGMAALPGTLCELWHDDNCDYDAISRVYLDTPSGLRYVDRCSEHDDEVSAEMVALSAPVDDDQQWLESAIDAAMFGAWLDALPHVDPPAALQ